MIPQVFKLIETKRDNEYMYVSARQIVSICKI